MLARSRTYWVADTGQEISAPGNYLIQTSVFSTATASTCPETTRGEITIQLVFRDKQGQRHALQTAKQPVFTQASGIC